MSAYELLSYVPEVRFSRDRLFRTYYRYFVGFLAQAIDRSLSMDHEELQLESGSDR